MLKKLKNFCRLTRRSEGFTLVELVVVIAIVAILSGIAVPAYGAYVEKSQKAGDLQLLAAVNKAFAAAAFENGDGIDNVQFAELLTSNDVQKTRIASTSSYDGAYTIVGIKSVTLKNGTANIDNYDKSFKKYYADNLQSEFKAIERLYFKDGAFGEDIILEITVTDSEGNKITLNIPTSDIENFEDTLLYEKLGVPGLTDKIDYVTGFASDLMGEGGSLNTYIMSDAQQAALAKALGYDNTDAMLNDNEGPYAAMVGSWYEKYLADGLGDDEAFDKAQKQVMANYAVVTSAQAAKNMSVNSIKTMLSSGEKAKEMIKQGDANTVLTQAALAYGMYTSYAYSEYGSDAAIKATENPDAIMDSLNDPNFQKYLATEQATADLNGYLSAFSMASNVAQNSSQTLQDALTNGYSDANIQNMINQVMNSKK